VKLLLVMSFLFLTLLLLGSLIGLQTTDLRLMMDSVHADQAYYLAEAGLLHAEQQARSDPTWRGQWTAWTLGVGTCQLRVTEQGAGLLVESVATVAASKQQLTRLVPR